MCHDPQPDRRNQQGLCPMTINKPLLRDIAALVAIIAFICAVALWL